DAELLDRPGDASEQFGVEVDAILHADSRGEAALVCRAEDRPALRQDAGGVLRRERDVANRIVKALIPFEEPEALVAELPRGFDDAANDRVESGAIAAAGEDADPLAHDENPVRETNEQERVGHDATVTEHLREFVS